MSESSNPVVRAEIGRNQYATLVNTRGHEFRLDEPTDRGGTDVGATPVEHALAALAGCKTITLRMYADRKGMNLESVRVKVERDEETIRCTLELEGDLTDDEKERLRQIGDRCPVHKMMSGQLKIESTIGEVDD